MHIYLVTMSCLHYFAYVLCLLGFVQNGLSDYDYGEALTKSLLYFEAQRSGKLPSNQRVQWRGDSALNDGKTAGVDLVGGYYDAGDNVKFGFPMAFAMTMLSWSVVQFGPHLTARNELSNALNAIEWGTDYLIKAHAEPEVLYGQVGDGQADHSCWQRPEDMTTDRTAFRIDEQHPGSDLAAETAAAFAAASIAFRSSRSGGRFDKFEFENKLFDFATTHTGLYQDSIPAGAFYSSSGYEDELLWAAAWLALATKDDTYISFINMASNGGTRKIFSWDDKFVGAQVLITKSVLEKKYGGIENVNDIKNNAEQFICNCINKGSSNIPKTSGGLLWFLEDDNLQYVASASFLVAAYADTLAVTKTTITCPNGDVGPQELIEFAQSQVDYILGSNPEKLSYMVGFGENYPKRPHHRGASIVSIKQDPTPVSCQGGFDLWFHKNADNPNVIEGALVGGPNFNDEYSDNRENFQQAEPDTDNVAPLVGVLARLA
ncbi:hypothetical protein ACS0TY_012435 [Phlomoides rotata]